MSETLPTLDLNQLTAADMRTVIALGSMSGTERANAMLDLLDRAVDGGLAAIPLPRLPAYLKTLDQELEELMNPKG